MELSNGVVWSLFDGSGLMVEPWAKAGYQCFCFNSDGGNHGKYEAKVIHPNIHYVDVWIDAGFRGFVAKSGIPSPSIIFSFPDCTFFAQSGSQHERTSEQLNSALFNARLAQSLAFDFGCPWMVENPVGKLSSLWRKPDSYFNPYEYGGYLTAEDGSFHPKMPLLDAYTKKTCIWHGGGFVMPEKKPVDHIGCFWGWKFLGGASAKTKQLRSLTPRGFSRAVFNDNSTKC